MSANDTMRKQMLRYLDGTLPEMETRALNAQLATAPELQREFAELLRQQVQLAELGAELAERVIPLPAARAAAWWRRPLAVTALAACLALLAALAVLFRPAPARATKFRFTSLSGEVWVQRGDVKHRATDSGALLPGDRVQTSFGAQAVMQASGEATRFALREETTFSLPPAGSKKFTLEEGSFAATVAPQPRGEPFVCTTPQGEATVLGTAFVFATDTTATHLAVTEGRVQLRRHADGASVPVAAQQLAVAAENVPLAPRALPADGQGTGLLGEYFPGRQFERPQLRRLDAQVQFNWDKERPAPGVGIDHFQVRWTGTVLPKFSERYLLELVADDGVRLWVDGHLLIDQWDIRSRQTKMRGEIALVAGRKHDLRLEFFEASARAFVSLYWQSDSQPREVIPRSQLYPASP